MWFTIINIHIISGAKSGEYIWLKYLVKTSKTPAEDVVVVRDDEEVHRSVENDHREKRQAEVKSKYELERLRLIS